tara:strand:+ start:1118 stop:1816 length:699 start_codon:yes stop_codon:yes gene_type:complete
MNKDLIFTATYNEADNISTFLDSVLKIPNIDILIIDDNSPDRTGDIIKQYQNNNKNLFLVSRDGKEGLDSAHKIGFNFAKDKDYENLITLDADLSHDPNMIPLFLKTLEDKPFVIGSRYMTGATNDMKFFRYCLSFVGNKIIKYVLKIDSDEFTSSFRGFALKRLKTFDINNVKTKGYSFFMGTIYLISKLGFKINQIPLQFVDRKRGASKIPKIEILRTLKNLLFIKINKL